MSYATLKLDNTFSVRVKVLGLPHSQLKGIVHGSVFDGVDEMHSAPFFHGIPKNFMNSKNECIDFTGICLPLALIMATYAKFHEEGLQSYSYKYGIMRNICNPLKSEGQHRAACAVLNSIFENLAEQYPVLKEGDKLEICKVFSSHFQVNVILHKV